MKTDSGDDVTLSALQGKPVVLFYPKDDTPGGTIECKSFSDARAEFRERAHVFGISPDDIASHQAFRDKYGLNFRCSPIRGTESPISSEFGARRRTETKAFIAPRSSSRAARSAACSAK